MSEFNLDAEVEELAQIAEENGADVDADQIESEINELVEYSIPPADAAETIQRRHNLYSSDISPVADIEDDDQWFDIEAKVIDLWDPRSSAVAQTGLLGDESGTIKFTWFHGSELPTLEEGASYRFAGVVSDMYKGRVSIKLTSATDVAVLDRDIEVADNSGEFDGRVVDIKAPSGLIKRCSEEGCNRVLKNGRCPEHGAVEGEHDLRIKAVVDDGVDSYTAIFDAEAVEELIGIDVDEAVEMAQEALDTKVVDNLIESEILATRFHIEGPVYENGSSPTIVADSFEEISGVTAEGVDSVLIRARSAGA